MPSATKTVSRWCLLRAKHETAGRARVPARLRGGPLKPYAERPTPEAVLELGELERLSANHDLTAFDAGPADTEGQAAWLRERALQNNGIGHTRVFVAPYVGTPRVAAFFGIVPGSVIQSGLPRGLRPRGTPQVISAWFIARLAVDQPLQGRGIGRDLMLAALSRIVKLHQEGGGVLVVVDAASERAQHLYAQLKFVSLKQTNPEARTTRMVAPMADVIELLREL